MTFKTSVTFAGSVLLVGVVLAISGCNGEPMATPVAEEEVEHAVEDQKFCPVMEGMEIDSDLYVDHEGKRVFFCCAGCIPAFQQDPERYMEKLHEIHEDPDAVGEHDHDHQ